MEDDLDVYTFLSEYLKGFRNDTIEFKSLQVRQSIVNAVHLLVFLYSLLAACGTTSNTGLLYCIYQQPTPRHYLSYYIINLAVVNILKCVIVLPISLTNSIFQNWLFGDNICYILPMIQEISLHITGWTYYVMSKRHLNQLKYPGNQRYGSDCMMLILTWIVGFILVIPYRFYVRYIDFGKILGDHKILKYQFEGVGICAVRSLSGIREYVKGIFIVMCLVPLILSMWRFKEVSDQLHKLKIPQIVTCCNSTIHMSKTSFSSKKRDSLKLGVNFKHEPYKIFVDVRKEKISLRYLFLMLALDTIFLLPLKVVRLFKFIQNNLFTVTWNYDMIFIVLVWIAFLPTCIISLLYASWQLSL
ncbi:neuropeptide receptor npr-1-like [Lycorma delicatula]|uniref:neuropeptide receptor npr-1-like n=1 Tax=Lycorma delicatula TaxID=130591 RepID=UPI003F5137A5